ncbi:MerR family DNA-binding transcriptional regulator [Nocardioides lijunqiniae]|uniref:MerR family DNA-binding transcriptional regulator n=1 Tax=Nocardioides lijunqiniae TaxID=2760832 RepID=UPI001878CB43|nr:MerR family DNA-binding transcriptional regulator [Nocardioides lijunqiniae]
MTAALAEEKDRNFNLTVRDVAEAAGIAPSAVRFYEAHGLITARRTAGNQRRFDENAACLIKVARVAQRVGLTVRDIAQVFATLPPNPTPADWDFVSDTMIREAENRVTALRRHLEDLASDARLCDL